MSDTTLPDRTTPQEMTRKLESAYARLWWVISLLEDEEIDAGAMADGWSPKVLIGQIAAWNTIHVRRMYKVVRPEHLSFLERNNGGIMSDDDLNRLRARDTLRAAVDARVPLDAVLADLERSQEWTLHMLSDAESDVAKALANGAAEPQLYELFDTLLDEMRERTRRLRRWCGSMQRWNTRNLLALLEDQHELLMESIAGLDETTILQTITHEPWSMRDELVHVLAWNEFELRLVDAWPHQQESDIQTWMQQGDEGEDGVNERLAAERVDLNMIEVVDALATVHRRTIKRLEAGGEALLASEGNWFFGVTGPLSDFVFAMALHQAEHSEWLWKTRQALESNTQRM
jgi:hypothetical protein